VNVWLLPHFLAFLPENVSSERAKAHLNGSYSRQMMMNNVTTGYVAEFAAITPLMF